MRTASLLLLMMATFADAQHQAGTKNTGSIQGMVVDSVTHQPVREAVVSLEAPGDPDPGRDGSYSRTTDAAGTFAIDNLQPGRYLLGVSQRLYPQEGWRSIAIKTGERAPVIVELVPSAAVSGRVLDDDGDPLAGCSVRLLSAKPPYQEVMATQDFREVLGSSEDGKYRVSDIVAGKYILTAQCQGAVFQARPLLAGPDPLPTSAYPPQFYPIEFAPGEEKSGVDFRMKPSPVTHIHVVLTGVADWHGRKDLAWQLVPMTQEAATRTALRMQGRDLRTVWHQMETANGEFEIPKVFPGSYRLLVTSNALWAIPSWQAPGGQTAGAIIGAAKRIDVGDKPMRIELALRPPLQLNGTIEIVGPGGENRVKPNEVSVQLDAEYPAFFPGNGGSKSTKDDGTFTITSVFPGPSRITVHAYQRCGVHCMQDVVFLKSTWFGGAELTGGLLDLSSGAPGEVRIVVSTNFAAIRGTAPAFAIVGASTEERWSAGRYDMHVQADQNGRFQFEGLVPGNYRLGLLDRPGSDGSGGGQAVTLQEGQTRAVELRTAPGAQ